VAADAGRKWQLVRPRRSSGLIIGWGGEREGRRTSSSEFAQQRRHRAAERVGERPEQLALLGADLVVVTDRAGAGEEQTLLDGKRGAGEFVECSANLGEFTRIRD
jgi:hypothetical protein